MTEASMVASTAFVWYPSPMLLMLLLALILPLPPLPPHFSIPMPYPSSEGEDGLS